MNSPHDRAGPAVLILVQNLPVPFDRRVWQEATALRDAGFRVHVACPRTRECTARRESIDGIDIRRYPPGVEARTTAGYLVEYSIALLWMLVIALRIRVRVRIDFVHICNPPDLLFLVALPLKILGAGVIFDHHDAGPELMLAKGYPPSGVVLRISRALERCTFAVADVSLATNRSYRDIAISRGRMAPDNVFIVRSAPAENRFANAKPSERWRNGRRYLVGYLGVMGRQDGLDDLIEAAHLIVYQHSRTDIQFVCVGGGPELPRLRRRAEDLGLANFIQFPGRIPDDDVGEALASSDVCVNPDTANEMNDISTMNKILEYMALRKPIVQYDLKEGKFSAETASLYAKPNDVASFADCILSLLSDERLRREMGEAGNLRLRTRLAWEMQIPDLLGAYRHALKNRHPTRALPSRGPCS